MLHLDSISIHNFKSFRHANITLLKGFNCVLGPNGSGKSNICDSILFALGESSLKRLRVSRSDQLIHGSAKVRNDGARKAYVKLVFGGDKNLEVTRTIKSNGKIGYRIDGKRARRQDVIDALRSYRCAADATNVIAQGEISQMQSLTPKERRELIDVASGIRDFEEKRDISIKELEKVEARVREAQIELGLKQGFLKELEKQKSDAEAYTTQKEYIERGNYTILKAKEQEISALYDSAAAEIKGAESKAAKINETMLKLESSIQKLSSERAAYSRELNEKSVEVGSTNKKLEEIEKERAVKEQESRSIREHIQERESVVESSIRELDELNLKTRTGAEQEEAIRESARLKEAETGSNRFDELVGSDTSGVLDLYAENQKKIDALQSRESALSSRSVKASIGAESMEKEARDLQAAASRSAENLDALAKKRGALSKELETVGKNKSSIKGSIDLLLAGIAGERKKLEATDSKMLEIKSQLAMSGSSMEGRIEAELKRALPTGFYGAAHTLCTYDERYDAAVSASASGRLNYFIVESKDVAEKAISVLKSRQLGRASFIPLDFIAVQGEKPANGDLLISHIKFDKKYERAFAYVFSNTCMVNSISEVNRQQLGRNRFVTYDGELVEPSGVISGGGQRNRTSASSLQSRLRALEQEKSETWKRAGELETQLESAKKEYSEQVSKELNLAYETKRIEELATDAARSAKEAESMNSSLSMAIKSLKAEAKATEEELSRITKEIQSLKAQKEAMLKKSMGSSKPKEHRASEVSKYKSAMKEAEALKVQLASTIKENEMLKRRIKEIESAISTLKGQITGDRQRLAIIDGAMIELSNAKSELQDEIKAHGTKYGTLMSKMVALEGSINKASMEKGRATAELNRAEKELFESNTKRAQLQTRLSDIKAELSSMQKVEPIVGEQIPDIETKIVKAKVQLEALGLVNLKAPEAYAEKKEEVAKAEEKMSILASEKESILNMIKEIESKKLSVFKETFNQVNENFKRLHSYVFGTGAYLNLDNQKDPLNSGLHIALADGYNKNIMIEQHSGGEKTLMVLMLIFSIQMRNPLSFYIFDEIDVSLDKENIKKLSRLVAELSKTSQMIVVSHNDTMITAADSAIGVVRSGGNSSAIGLKIEGRAKIGA
jgi:chromosome segregation protein